MVTRYAVCSSTGGFERCLGKDHILVTGVNGFMGAALLQRWLSMGEEIISFEERFGTFLGKDV